MEYVLRVFPDVLIYNKISIPPYCKRIVALYRFKRAKVLAMLHRFPILSKIALHSIAFSLREPFNHNSV